MRNWLDAKTSQELAVGVILSQGQGEPEESGRIGSRKDAVFIGLLILFLIIAAIKDVPLLSLLLFGFRTDLDGLTPVHPFVVGISLLLFGFRADLDRRIA